MLNLDKQRIYTAGLNDTKNPKVALYKRLANYSASGMLSREYFATAEVCCPKYHV